ncbi:MAG: sigma-E factor negative regulatory protein [Gammaproteobacteria bacterium]|nr:sigma-E factor negative regulatory protein [Gammaproteobacteria bacterium]MBQ0839774.1 sigma-E factor negative regulatory protein [Gammaproteobacteria bacterium]
MNEKIGKKMRETLSALKDDEASELELHRAMREVGEDESLNDTWSRYHLAASAMRKELPVDFVDSSAELRAAINMALVNEPVPQRALQWPQTLGRVAIAASVAVFAIFGAQQYQVFEPSAAMPLIAQGEIQHANQNKAGETGLAGPQFQLPSGFEVPQATARTASTGSSRVASTGSYSSHQYSRSAPADLQPRADKLETDRQIQAYMQRLMSQQAERNYRHSNSIFLPAEHGAQQVLEP